MATDGEYDYKLRLSFDRPPAEEVDEYRDLPSNTISDALGKRHTLHHSIKPVYSPCSKLVGPALTVSVTPGDELLPLKAIDVAEPGDVIVVSGAGPSRFSLWGGIMSEMASVRGVAGLVTDGLIRDVDEMRDIDFPVYGRGVTPVAPAMDVPPGEMNYPIAFGNVTVHPGDLVVADEDGVVIVPQDQLQEVRQDVASRIEREEEWREEIHATGEMILSDRIDALLAERDVLVEDQEG